MEKEAQLNTIINLELKISQNEIQYQFDDKSKKHIDDFINLKSPPLSPITNVSNDSSLDNHDVYDDDYQIVDNSNRSITSDITNTSFECVDSSDLSDLMNEIELKIENSSMNSDDATDALIESSLFKNDEELLGEEISIKIDTEQDNQEQVCEEVEVNVEIAARKETLTFINGPLFSSINENEIDFAANDNQVAQNEDTQSQNIPEIHLREDYESKSNQETMNNSTTCLSDLFKEESNNLSEDTNDSNKTPNNSALMNSVCENDIEVSPERLNLQENLNETPIRIPYFASKLTNSQIENEISSEIGLK
jgi:hypothetical protein